MSQYVGLVGLILQSCTTVLLSRGAFGNKEYSSGLLHEI